MLPWIMRERCGRWEEESACFDSRISSFFNFSFHLTLFVSRICYLVCLPASPSTNQHGSVKLVLSLWNKMKKLTVRKEKGTEKILHVELILICFACCLLFFFFLTHKVIAGFIGDFAFPWDFQLLVFGIGFIGFHSN